MAEKSRGRIEQIGRVAKLLRKRAGLSQTMAAEILGQGVDVIRSVEQGTRADVGISLLESLASAYGYDVGAFLRDWKDEDSLPDPDPARQRAIWLRVRDGIEIDPDLKAEILDYLDEKERQIRAEWARKKRRSKSS